MVQESHPKFIMTSYNKINGVWSHYNWELVTKLLRGEWGYKGCVMTDWWMRYAASPEFPALRDNAYRVRAQVDVLMPGSKEHSSTDGGNDGSLLETFGQDGGNPAEHITLGELQRTARNVLNFVMQSSAMER
jgi:beta-glucosidase